jgi:heme A synthase
MNGNIWVRDRTASPEKRAACGDPAVGAPRPFARTLLVGLLLALLALNVLGAVMVVSAQQPHETSIHMLAAD